MQPNGVHVYTHKNLRRNNLRSNKFSTKRRVKIHCTGVALRTYANILYVLPDWPYDMQRRGLTTVISHFITGSKHNDSHDVSS